MLLLLCVLIDALVSPCCSLIVCPSLMNEGILLDRAMDGIMKAKRKSEEQRVGTGAHSDFKKHPHKTYPK